MIYFTAFVMLSFTPSIVRILSGKAFALCIALLNLLPGSAMSGWIAHSYGRASQRATIIISLKSSA
jgi:hypothetical protein